MKKKILIIKSLMAIIIITVYMLWYNGIIIFNHWLSIKEDLILGDWKKTTVQRLQV